MAKQKIETRIEAYNLMKELKENGISRKQIVEEINNKFSVSKITIYDWYRNKCSPLRRGIEYRKELFYVLGALLGDGCIYHWKKMDRRIINIIGEEEFTRKYAEKLSKCTGKLLKNYINRSNNTWFVNTGNIELYFLFQNIRKDLSLFHGLLKNGNYRENSLQLIEGYFDAEGCVKIIKEPVRKTPKICLDICTTDYKVVELVRQLLNEHLDIEAKYSIQKAFIGKDGSSRKIAYHLRIYKKEYIKKFLENIKTTKLKPEKMPYVERWFNNGK